MDLHERLTTTRAAAAPETTDAFAEPKNAIHMAVITELGPQAVNVNLDPTDLRERVNSEIRRRLMQEAGLTRDDRDRLGEEIADDILGHGPLERLLQDDSVTEIMVNGPYDIWIERQGRLHETNVRFSDE